MKKSRNCFFPQVIPATPKEKTEGTVRKGGRRRRVRKQVDKTYVDDDG